MKKTTALFLAFLSLSLVSCGEEKTPIQTSVSASSSPTESQDNRVSTSESTSANLTEVLENGNLAFAENTYSEVAKAKDGDSSFEAFATISYELLGSDSCTEANVKVTSSNPAIIPDDAITQENTTEKASNVLTGGTLTIDLTKVQLGETFITIDFKGHNGNSPKGSITKKITIVNYGEVITTHYQQNVTFDFSKVTENASLLTEATINCSSLDVPYGCDLSEQVTSSAVKISSDKTQTVSFYAIPRISYYLSVSYRDSSDKAHFFYLSQRTTLGSDYSYSTSGTSSKAIYGNSTAATQTIKVLDQVTN